MKQHSDVSVHHYTAACTFIVTYYEISGEKRNTRNPCAVGEVAVAKNLMLVLKYSNGFYFSIGVIWINSLCLHLAIISLRELHVNMIILNILWKYFQFSHCIQCH